MGASRRTWQKRTPRGLRSPSFSVGAVFPTRLWAGHRGQLRGVRVCEWPQRRGRDRTARRRQRRRGTSRTGQAGKRPGGGRGRAQPRISQDWEKCPSCSFLSPGDTETMTQMAGLSQISPSLPSIWHSISKADSVEVLESPRLKLGVD